MCYQQRRAIFIDFDLDCATRNKKKTMYFTESMKFLAFRLHHFVILWAQASVFEEFIIPR